MSAFGLAGISEPFIPIFYGDGYEDSVGVLIWLLPSMAFVGWANIIRTQYLLPKRMDTEFCLSVVLGAVVNVVVNIILIPIYGAKGAAISTTMAEFTVCIVQSFVAFRNMHLLLSLKKITPYIILGIFMYVLMIHIETNSNLLTVLVRTFLGGTTYLLLSAYFLKKYVSFKTLKSRTVEE